MRIAKIIQSVILFCMMAGLAFAGQIELTNQVKGVLPIANGGTNATSFTAPVSGVNAIPYFDGTRLVTDVVPSDFGYNAASGIANFNAISAASSITGAALTGTSLNGVTIDSTTNKPVTAASLNGGTLPADFTSLIAAGPVDITGNEQYISLYSTLTVGANPRARIRAIGSGGGSGFGGSFTVDTRTNANVWNTWLTISDSGATNLGGSLSVGSTIATGGYTVAGLPTCTVGLFAYVTDAAAAPTYLGTATGGGTLKVPVFCNGTNWVYH